MANSRRMCTQILQKMYLHLLTTESQIVYVAIMGPILSAAFLEWFLWLAAFLYCLVKVFLKAEHWSIRLLAVVMMFGFTLLR